MDVSNGLALDGVAQECYEAFLRTNSEQTQDELLRAMRLSEGILGLLTIQSPEHVSEVPLSLGGLLVAREVVSDIEVQDAEPSAERELFIQWFEKGIEAFQPEPILHSEKAELFALAWQAQQRPNGDKAEKLRIINARADLIERLTGKRYESEETYHGISMLDIFQTAHWIRGGHPDGTMGEERAVDPVDVYALNPSLYKYSQEQIARSAQRLADSSGAPIDKILTSAHRGIYRGINNAQQIDTELAKMRELGILHHAKRRPDIFNYPLKVLLEKEDQYVAMGIPLEVIRSEAKFYVYKPETILDRIQLVDSALEAAAGYLSPQERQFIGQEFRSKPRLIIDCGRPKIAATIALIQQYATPRQWAEVRAQMKPDNPFSMYASILQAFGRLRLSVIETEFLASPDANLFLTARQIINAGKVEQARRRRSAKTRNQE